jgi:hypothetical protein
MAGLDGVKMQNVNKLAKSPEQNEKDRLRCEAEKVLSMAKQARQGYLSFILTARGKAACDALKAEIMAVHGARKAAERVNGDVMVGNFNRGLK